METPFTIIIGLGKTGLSCVHYLQRQGKKVAVMDSRENPPGLAELRQQFPHLPIYLGKFDEAILAKAQELIMSPGVALQEPAIAKQIARGAKAIGDIELFAQAAKAPIVAITGTNGKSTVTTLVGEMAKVAGLKVGVGGNLGTPVLELLADDTQLYVLEISSFQLETTFSLKPQVATVLNISPDHLDRYPSMQEYITAKQRIYQQCKIAVINRQDKVSYSGLPAKTPVISFGLDEPKQGEFGCQRIGLKLKVDINGLMH
jgi:UDP-N-acetylmuramoylalanine--D-glutamate ligase